MIVIHVKQISTDYSAPDALQICTVAILLPTQGLISGRQGVMYCRQKTKLFFFEAPSLRTHYILLLLITRALRAQRNTPDVLGLQKRKTPTINSILFSVPRMTNVYELFGVFTVVIISTYCWCAHAKVLLIHTYLVRIHAAYFNGSFSDFPAGF